MNRRRALRIVLVTVLALAATPAIPYLSARVIASGHLYDEADMAAADAPRADLVLVLGAEVERGDTGPKAFLRGRLDTAGQLLRDGYGKVLLVSGDGSGNSGNETGVMTAYLTGTWGVAADQIVADPYGLDTYDSCLRA